MKRLLPISLLLATLGGCATHEQPNAGAPAHWQISSEYISNTLILSNDALKEEIKSGQLVPLKAKDLGANIIQRTQQMARRMKLHPAPALYRDASDTRALPQAGAHFTKQGKAYIVINQSARDAWSPRQLIAVIGHELVHLKERHVTAARLAEAYNHPEISVAHELTADRVGAGPLGSCDPKALEEAIAITIRADKQNYLMENPLKGAGDYNDLMAGDHPRWAERKAALDAMIASPPKGCDKHE